MATAKSEVGNGQYNKVQVVGKENDHEEIPSDLIEGSTDKIVDRFRFVYIIALILGLVQILPWNVLGMAHSYFVDYKLNTPASNETDYRKYFMNYFGTAYMIAVFLFNAVNVFSTFEASGDVKPEQEAINPRREEKFNFCSFLIRNRGVRIIAGIAISGIVLMIHVLLAILDTSGWPLGFFYLTMGLTIFISIGSAFFNSNTFGLFSPMPMAYINALILGNNIGGTAIATVRLITQISSPDPRISSIYYFCVAFIFLLLSLICYLLLPFLRFYRYYIEKVDAPDDPPEIELDPIKAANAQRERVRSEVARVEEKRLRAFSMDLVSNPAASSDWEASAPASKSKSRSGTTEAGVGVSLSTHALSNSSASNNAVKSVTVAEKDSEQTKAPMIMQRQASTRDPPTFCCGRRVPPYWRIIKKTWVHLLALWTVCFATLAVYPSVQVKVAMNGDVPEWMRPYWTSVTTFLLFASCSMIGNITSSLFPWPPPKWYWPLCHIRTVVFIPFFIFCALSRNSPPDWVPYLFKNDWVYIAGNIIFAYSNGHLASLAVMYNPKCVETKYSAIAGMLGSLSISSGLLVGSLSSFLWIFLIET